MACNREAPGIEQLARTKKNLRVVGVGTQDTFADAQKFVARAKIKTVTMLYDESARSWNYWRVSGQPAALLVDANGKFVKAWTGELNIAAVIAAAGV